MAIEILNLVKPKGRKSQSYKAKTCLELTNPASIV
jgi:hypothetical protein